VPPESESNLEKSQEPMAISGMQRVLEASIVTTTLLSLYLLLALYSFNPMDAAWTQTAVSGISKNWMGHTGAYLADILFFSVGFLAYSLPFLLAVLGYVLFKAHHKIRGIDFFTLGLRFIGFFLTAFGVLASASINFDDIHQAFSAGGVIGELIATAMLPNFNFLGTTLLLVCFIATGMTLLTGISWIQVVDHTGAMVVKILKWLWQIPVNYRARKAQQQVNVEATQSDIIASLSVDEENTVPQITNSTPAELTSDVHQAITAPTAAVIERDAEPDREQIASLSHDEVLDNDLSPYQRPQLNLGDLGDIVPSNEPNLGRIEEIGEPSNQALADAIAAVQPKVIEIDDDREDRGIDGLPPVRRATTPLPPLELLDAPKKLINPIAQEDLDRVSRLVEAKLLDFNVQAVVVDVFPGPVITRFELDLAPGIKVSKISGLSKDLARSLSALSVRVVEVIPGKSVIGIEIPNENREIVYLRENLSSDKFIQAKSPLTMVLGKDIAGSPVVVDLGKMPHLLVAGTTGSGKSVGVNAMILSLLYKSTPEQVRMIMIDPKMLELSVYEGIPHLLSEVVTDMKEAANALRWCVGEMERRYKLLSAVGVRNLAGYNAKIIAAKEAGVPLTDPLWKPGDSMDEVAPELETLPSIVVIVDEFADMIMIVGKKVEELIARIAQKARAAGIHLILATQRPSVDVITGLIKANIPTRIAFQVSSRVDSRTILDQQGAEQLLGQGDMLYLPPGTGVPTRVHGAFVDDHEVHKVVADWKLRGKPNYIDAILSGESSESILLPGEAVEGDDENDEFYDDAVAFVTETRRGSISSVQRKFKIGYNRAARLIEQMEASGVVSSPGHNGTREVIAPPAPRM